MALLRGKNPKATRQGNGKNSYFSTHKHGKNHRKRGKKYRGQGKKR